MKKLLLLFITTLTINMVLAQAVNDTFTVGDYDYIVTSVAPNEAEVTGFATGSSTTDVNLPVSAEDSSNSTTYSVTSIAVDAFRDDTTITSLTLPSTLTTINNHAFNGCNSLAAAPLDFTNVTSIGDYAFLNCTNITSVTIPEGINFGLGVLRGTGITSINIPASWITLPVQMVRDCLSIESIIIPSTVTTFGTAAFRGCTNLTQMQINGTSVISLENNNAIATLPSTCILYVPDSATETAYEGDATWSNYFDAARIVAGTLTTNNLEKLEVNLFPNPTKDVVTVKSSFGEDMTINVYNTLGKKLLTTRESQVDISSFSAGVYLLRVETSKGATVKRIIKQ